MRELLNQVYEEIQSSGLNSKVRVQGILDLLKTTVDSTYARPYQKYPKIRAFLTSSFGQDSLAAVLARSTFRMTREEYAEVQKKGRERTIQRNIKQTLINYGFVLDVVDWLRANDMTIDKIALLMLSSGARRCEIMDTGRSEFVEESGYTNHIRQNGFAKKGPSSEVESVVKPLLFLTSGEFLSILEDVRKDTSHLNLDDHGLYSQYDDRLERLAKECFPQFVFNDFPVGTHVCRAVYVNIAYHLHHMPRESIVAFAARVLGHEGLSSVPNYLHVSIVFNQESEEGKEATKQEEQVKTVMTIIDVHNSEGTVFRLRPIPHRRLTKEERITLKQSRLRDLENKRITLSLPMMKLLKLA